MASTASVSYSTNSCSSEIGSEREANHLRNLSLNIAASRFHFLRKWILPFLPTPRPAHLRPSDQVRGEGLGEPPLVEQHRSPLRDWPPLVKRLRVGGRQRPDGHCPGDGLRRGYHMIESLAILRPFVQGASHVVQ